MRIRALALATLIVVGLVPLGLFALASIGRSEATAVAEVRAGAERLAASAAERIAAYAAGEAELLHSIGAALAFADSGEADALREVYELGYPHLHGITVYDPDGQRLVGPGVEDSEALLSSALAGDVAEGPVRPAGASTTGGYAHSQIIAQPISIAGARRGAVAALVDLAYVWKPVNQIQIGDRGFARLLAFDGTLLAHGDPEERRYVYAGQTDPDGAIVAGSLLRQMVTNLQGEPVVAAMAVVPGKPWLVNVEQPVAQAFAATRAMKRDLAVFGAAAILLATLAGLLLGRGPVRSLEALRSHTGVLAHGDLDARFPASSGVAEIRALAVSLNDMAGSIKRLHDEARARERLATFARVAAGLAHDLRQPIEAMRTACAQMLNDPDDADARELFAWVNEKELPRLKRFVDDLQRIAHQGDVRLDYEELSPRALAEDLSQDLRANPKWRGVIFDVAGDACALVADRGLVRRAVFNLAANGADACVSQATPGTVTIEVADVQDGAACELRVRDNGGGMPGESVARLMAGDFHSTKRSSGVGLGFGVALHVAEAHGGAIVAETVLGQGSTFALRIPRRERPSPGAHAPGDQVGLGVSLATRA